MAGNTITGSRGPVPERGFVAAGAGNIGVRIAQRKAGLSVVIELPRPPGRRIVASIALLAERTAMGIVACVAGSTVGTGVVKCRGRMAPITRYLRVRTHQRKTHQVMVEPYSRNPVGRDVTALALRAQLPFMCVFIPVAAGATSR